MAETVLVTGGAGFIGSHLCEALIKRGDSVLCFDSFDAFYDPSQKRRNLEGLKRAPNFDIVQGDILDVEQLEDAMREANVSQIVHLAARAGVRPSLQQPALYYRVNVEGTINLLEIARRMEINSVVLASSSSVYGANSKVPFEETDAVEQPISPYAASKRGMELAASVYPRLYGMDVLCHRFFTVYGPRQRPDMAINKFVRAVSQGQPIEMYGAGQTRRDYTFIKDIISGLVASIDRAPGMGFQVFNLGNSQTVTLSELIDEVGRAVGREPIVKPMPEQPGDVEQTFANVEKARKMLDYQPTTPLREGLQQYVAWLRKNGEIKN